MSGPENPIDRSKTQNPVEKRDGERSPWNPGDFLGNLKSYHDNQKLPEYEEMVATLKKRFQKFGDQYAIHWKEMLEGGFEKEKIAFLHAELKGKTVIDLGGGYTIGKSETGIMPSAMQEVAQELGALVYVNIDQHLPRQEMDSSMAGDRTESLGIKQPATMRVIYTQEDMLTFLAQMQNETPEIAIALNGIDDFVVPDARMFGYRDSYFKILAKEIARVLPIGGVALTWGSEDAVEFFNRVGLELAPGFPEGSGMFAGQVWIKK